MEIKHVPALIHLTNHTMLVTKNPITMNKFNQSCSYYLKLVSLFSVCVRIRYNGDEFRVKAQFPLQDYLAFRISPAYYWRDSCQ